LRRWEPALEPGFFLQQLRNCCLEFEGGDVQALIEARLGRGKWPWLRERVPTSRASEALVRTLEGHTSGVEGVAVTADGCFVVSASNDKTLKVWDIATGKTICTRAIDAQLSSCALTPDGRTIVAGDAMGAVHFVDWVRP
jgi:WD40 repeat protein